MPFLHLPHDSQGRKWCDNMVHMHVLNGRFLRLHVVGIMSEFPIKYDDGGDKVESVGTSDDDNK